MSEENKVVDTEAAEVAENVDNTIPVDFNLSNKRTVSITVNRDMIVQNVQSLQQDINRLLSVLQNVICVDDENRTNVQNETINVASSYLTNVNVPLTDYFHMNVDDYRLATTMAMDAIVACNTLIFAAQHFKDQDDAESSKVAE